MLVAIETSYSVLLSYESFESHKSCSNSLRVQASRVLTVMIRWNLETYWEFSEETGAFGLLGLVSFHIVKSCFWWSSSPARFQLHQPVGVTYDYVDTERFGFSSDVFVYTSFAERFWVLGHTIDSDFPKAVQFLFIGQNNKITPFERALKVLNFDVWLEELLLEKFWALGH